MKKNKTGKYLKYAIGEIVLVVIGILIALSINNWKEGQKADEFEYKILNEIYISLLENIEIVDRSINFHEMGKTSCQIILDHFKDNLKYHDSIELHFSRSLFWYKVSADYSAYETAKSYGLHIIENDSIRNLLSDIYEGDFKLIATFERRNHDFHYQNIITVTIDLFESTHHGILIPPSFTFQGYMIPINYDDLKTHQRYTHILNTLIGNRKTDIYFQKRLTGKLKKLERMIKTELDKK
jgi:hypothetical protein